MHRAIPVSKQITAGRNVVRAQRVVRRRLATEAAPTTPIPTPKKTNVVRRIVIYSTLATGTFYVGSAFVSFHNKTYHEFFTENVPLGQMLVQYGEAHEWDQLTAQQVIVASIDGVKYAVKFIRGQLGMQDTSSSSNSSIEKVQDAAKDGARQTKSTVSSVIQESKERIKHTVDTLKTTVEKTEDSALASGAKATAITKHRAAQFTDELEELIRRAEAALKNEPYSSPSKGTTNPEQAVATTSGAVTTDTEHASVGTNGSDKKWYAAPLPLGFEPPPGFTRPSPPKKAASEAPAPAPEPLPLVAPAVSELNVSEPVISHLASTIDNLASFLNSNPSAAGKAKDVLETAKLDLTGLAERIEKIKEEERGQLEQKLDEQAREYSVKLLELELLAQDKLDSQEEDYRKLLDEERAKFAQAYREKMEQELRTQTELINERLKEEVIAQGIEMQRRWIREVKVRVEQERGGRLAKLDELAANLKRLERIALDNSSYLDENIRVHAMWAALRALQSAVESPSRKPFREELRVLRHVAAAKDDPVTSAVLETLENTDIPDIGVEPFADLVSWFTTSVAPHVTSVALVPDQNAGVLAHLASHLLSNFTFRRQGLVPGSDVLSVLARAEYYMNEKDLDSATRELNQLNGTAKLLLADWLEAARRRLEVQQAFEVAQLRATLASLLVV